MKALQGRRVLIEQEPKEEKVGGIILPGQANSNYRKGKVIAIGEDVKNKNLVGERVLYEENMSTPIKPYLLEVDLKDSVIILDGNIECTLNKFKIGDTITNKEQYLNGGFIIGKVLRLEENQLVVEIIKSSGIPEEIINNIRINSEGHVKLLENNLKLYEDE